MPAIGITGGIATGKSRFLRALLDVAPAPHFDADSYVHALLESDAEVRAEICAAFGAEMLSPTGAVDRARVRSLVFGNEESRRRLEAILHPRVRSAWLKQATAASRTGDEFFYADIPLLYETASEAHFDRIVVVACREQTQRQRMRTQRGLAPALIKGMIGAQLDLAVKVARADHLIWNDSTAASLDEQARLLAAWLRQRYG